MLPVAQLQIFEAVVRSVVIDVVDSFRRQKRTAQGLRHHKTMLEYVTLSIPHRCKW